MTITFSNKNTAVLGFGSLGLASLGLEGGFTGLGIIDSNLLPQNFTVRRGTEGPQIIITWDAPLSAVNEIYGTNNYEVRLERKTLDWPYRKNEGTIVYSGTLNGSYAVSDYYPNIKEQYSYYYTLFIKLPTAVSGYTGDDAELFVTDRSLRKSLPAFKTGYFNQKLYTLLPGLYRSSDLFGNLSEIEKPLQKLTSQTGTSLLLNEKFNFLEDQGIKYGPLFRFLKTFGVTFDDIRNLIQYMSKIYDVDECDQKFLPLLASNYGLRLNRGLNITRQRAEVRNIVHFYKWKGTEEALRSRGEAVSTSPLVFIKEYNENTLLSNYSNRYSGNTFTSIGAKTQPYTIIQNELSNPNIVHSKMSGLYFNGYNGNVDSPGNRYTVVGTSDQIGSKITFSEITSYGGYTNLHPYRRLDFPGSFTVEAKLNVIKWPKPSSSVNIQGISLIQRTFDDNLTNKFTFDVRLNSVRLGTSNLVLHRLALYVGTTPSGTWIPIQLKEELDQITLNKSLHFAFVRDVNNSPNPLYSLYLNGTLIYTDSSIAYSVPDPDTITNGSGIVLGNSSNGGLRDAAYILDEVRVWDTVRTATEISSNYDKPINGSSKNLILCNTANYLKSTTVYDTSVYTNNGTSAKATRGSYPTYGPSLITDPNTTFKWDVSQHQKYLKNDKEFYVSSDPVGINGVRMYIKASKTDIIYPEVTS